MSQQLNNVEENFSAYLRRARGSQSQREMAVFLGLSSQQAYDRYEKGRIPKALVLQQISHRLNVTIPQLLGEEPVPDPSLLAKMRAEGVPDNIANAVATGPAGAVHRLNDADLNAALRRWFKDYRQEKEAHMSIMQLANIELCAAELRRRFESGAKGKP